MKKEFAVWSSSVIIWRKSDLRAGIN